MIDDHVADEFAERIWRARRQRRTLPALTEAVALTIDDAYAVQRAVQRRRLRSGQRPIGFKLGYTSAAMRRQMNVTTMNWGPLTDAMVLPDGGRVGDAVLQPRVEPEIAFVFARDVTAGAGRDDVMAAVGQVRAALEVVDSVWTDYQFQIEDNTADGSSACGVVLGPSVAAANLDSVRVVLRRNGTVVAKGTGAAASGHPAEGVVWLAEQLARTGDHIRAEDLVITGGLTRAVPLEAGDVVTARFDAAPVVSIRR